ncbi:Growth-regulating factor [Heracleum sosnowskyi]|uniref:Growth-regulating factor n=1 Tax=Heracleum sosnowskyi TaxID=360622 RepID=A0AAD8IK92_9APIA|nr:Growth-regulating factor [Heracleum sosnowskyi]
MRIRKGLLLSSSYMHRVSQTSSDPQLNQPTTPHELHPIPTNHVEQKPNTHSQPSDPSIQPPSDHPPKNFLLGCKLTNTSHTSEINQKVGEQVKSEDAASEEQVETGVSTRKQNIVFVDAPVTERSCHDKNWFDPDKKIPMSKKRKGLAWEKMCQETPLFEKGKRMESTTNKKCSSTSVQQNDGKQDKAGDDSKFTNHNMNVDKKINKRGGAIKEASRCSRVNGRGWRCCQQTLVGYSLCEHHLGKGRLRSMANVKGRAKMPTAASPVTATPNDTTDNTTNDNQPAKKTLVSSSVMQPARDCDKESKLLDGRCYDGDKHTEEEEDDDDYSDEEMKKPQVAKSKRTKLGMVKARSLSSLLNQTNNAVVVAADDN